MFNYGVYTLQEESPCIDAGDPSHPMDPDTTIADQGALFFDQSIPDPCVAVDLVPHGTPIFIPASGGEFTFDFELENICDSTVVVDVWTDVDLPTGPVFGPIILRTDITVLVAQTLVRELTQSVPANAPAGYYSYHGYAGYYPDFVIAEDHFSFGKMVDDAGSSPSYNWNVSGWDVETVASATPTEFTLSPAYPNPFNPETNLTFSLPEAGNVSLIVYDVSGREVARLFDGWYSAGVHKATFGASGLPSGVYFARLTAGDLQQTQKLMLMK